MSQFVLAAEEVRNRLERLKDLAPEFRADEIVHQMIQFRDASIEFPAKVGENGFMSPDRLSDAAFFVQLHTAARLPAWFAEPQRDGYVFEFTGDEAELAAILTRLIQAKLEVVEFRGRVDSLEDAFMAITRGITQ